MADPAITVAPLPAPASQPPANTNTPGVSDAVAPLLTSFTPSDRAVMAEQQKAAQDLVDSIKQNRADRQAVYAKMDALKQPDPKDFPLQNYGAPPPGMPDVQPIKAFGNWAVALAMLGSLLTRRPLTAALKAGGAAMQSFTQARWHDYQIQRQIWQDAMDQAMRQNQLENDQYRRAYDLYSGDLDKLSKELDRIAGDNSDNITVYQVRAGLIEEHYKLLTHREDMQQQYLMRREMAADREANRLAMGRNVPVGEQILGKYVDDYTKAHGHPPSAEEMGDFARKYITPGSVTAQTNLATTAARFDAAHKLIAKGQDILAKNPHVPGLGGEVIGDVKGAVNWALPGTFANPRRELDSTIADMRPLIAVLMKSRVSGYEMANVDEMLQGAGNWDDQVSAQKSWAALDQLLYDLQGKPYRYLSKEQVLAAYQAKELTLEEATQIITDQFGSDPAFQ